MTLSLLIILTVYIIVSLIVAEEFHSIAKLKGHTSSKYFFYPFLLGPAGWLIVVALPEKHNTIFPEEATHDQRGTSSFSSNTLGFDKKELLAKRAAADAVLKSKNELSDYQRKSLQNLIQSIDKKLENL